MKKVDIHPRVNVRAFGAYPEGLLNAAASAGLELWSLNRIDQHSVGFELYETNVCDIEALARKSGMELEIISKLEKRRRVFKNRYVFLLILLFVAFILLISSLFVWRIEVRGTRRLSRGEVLRALEDSGMAVGCFWPGIKTDELRSRIMLELPELAWMTVNVSGSRAIVLINEREEKPIIYNEAESANLVASKTGLVRRVSALSGKAVAEPGQAVTEGELLISGTLDSIMGTQRTVRARGSVMADTWYEIDSVCPEQEQIKNSGGFVRHRFALIFGKRRINFYISSGKAIDECDKIINEYALGLEGFFALPVKLVHERIVSYDTVSSQGYDTQAMSRQLARLLETEAKGQILQSTFTESISDGLYVLTLRAHCIENIARTQEIN